jgi:uncharacterized protein (TIGR03067 family)
MKFQALAVLAAGLMLAADAREAKDDHARIQGAWTVISGERGGKQEPAAELKSSSVVITRDRITVRHKDRAEEMAYKLDPSTKPGHIDLTMIAGPDKDKTAHGIYELSGDQLKICFARPGQERPTGFSTKQNSDQMCFVLKREKR